MKKKNFFRRLGWFFLIVLVILLYLLVYFFPAVIDINRSKREVKDIKMRIKDLGQSEINLLSTNRREKNIFKQTNRRFWKKIPKLQDKKARIDFIRNIIDHLRDTAAKEKIKNLIVTDGDKEWNVLYQNLSSPVTHERNVLLDQLEQFKKHRQRSFAYNTENQGHLARFCKGFSSLVFFVGLKGQLKKGIRMINRLPVFSASIQIERILIKAGNPFPSFLLKLKVYYREKTKSAYRLKKIQEDNINIDFNSPLLLQPVYFNLSGAKVKQELTGEWGRSLFIIPKGGR